MKGRFIVLEGPDGSGTTRHSQFLADRLRKSGIEVLLTAEPTDSPIGREIREILNSGSMPSADAIQLLFTADRANHVKNVIEPAMKNGMTVICDRYVLSTLIYGEALGVDRAWLEDINARFPQPDLTIITLPPFEVCMDRIDKRGVRDQFEKKTFQRLIYDAYQKIEDTKVVFVDTSGEKDIVADQVEKLAHEVLSFHAHTKNA